MYIMPIDNTKSFNGSVSRSAKKFICNNADEFGADFISVQPSAKDSLLSRFKNFMQTLHKNTILVTKNNRQNNKNNSANTYLDSAPSTELIFRNKSLRGNDIYVSSDELLLNSEQKTPSQPAKLIETLENNQLNISVDKMLYDKFRQKLCNEKPDLSFWGQVKLLYKANRASKFAKSIGVKENIITEVTKNIGEAMYSKIKSESLSKSKLPVKKRTKNI